MSQKKLISNQTGSQNSREMLEPDFDWMKLLFPKFSNIVYTDETSIYAVKLQRLSF